MKAIGFVSRGTHNCQRWCRSEQLLQFRPHGTNLRFTCVQCLCIASQLIRLFEGQQGPYSLIGYQTVIAITIEGSTRLQEDGDLHKYSTESESICGLMAIC